MFDFRKSVRRHHSIDVPFHDGFSADRDRYLLRDNNDILVTSAGVRIAGLKSLLKLPATSPKISGRPLNESFAKRGDAEGKR
jgi:hypothetical protein